MPRMKRPESGRATRIKLTVALVTLVVSLGIVALTIGSRPGRSPAKQSEAAAVARKPGGIAARESGKNLIIRRGQLWPHLKDALNALGNRLETPGKRQVTLTGILSRPESTNAFLLVQQFPNRLHFQEQGIAQPRTIAFDGLEVRKLGGSPDRFDEALVETFIYDSVDRLFIAQANGAATRFLGSRFRFDDGKAAAADGPVYDIYQVSEQITVGRGARSLTKSYYLNSDTLLLERVRYEVERDGARRNVEVLFGDWRSVEGQKVPFLIKRLEDGEPTITLTVATAAFGPPVSDGTFTQPRGNRQEMGNSNLPTADLE